MVLSQLGMMMKAGINLSLSMQIMIDSEKDASMKKILREINENLYLITDAHIFSDITIRQKDITLFATVKIKTVLCTFSYSKGVVVSEFKHISDVSIKPSRRCIVRSVIAANDSSWVTMTNVCPN